MVFPYYLNLKGLRENTSLVLVLFSPLYADDLHIYDFILSASDEKFQLIDPDLNPLFFYPIVEFDNKFYFLLISNQLNAINEYIIRACSENNISGELLKIYHSKVWEEQIRSCYKMNWELKKITLPKTAFDDNIKEAIFQFDTTKLVYVCYIHTSDITDIYKQESSQYVIDPELLEERLTTVKAVLKSRSELQAFDCLMLIIVDTVGRNLHFAVANIEGVYLAIFPAIELVNLISAEKFNQLSLWKFIKAYNKFLEGSKTISDILDIYSIYKSYGDSFYFSDDETPKYFIATPGDGSRLNKQNKIKQDLHGALVISNTQKGYLPVITPFDFAPLYKPYYTYPYYSLLLEIYGFPIWILNLQNDRGSAKITKYLAEAIGFWLYKLHASLSEIINAKTVELINIELIIDPLIFNEYTADQLEQTDVSSDYTYLLDGKTIKFNIPFGALKSFMGSNNNGERRLMNAVLNSLNVIPQINLSQEKIQSAIDTCIPLNNAKMFLLLDSKNNLTIDNRWLREIFYISDAEISMFLDDLPKIIEQHIEIPETIEDSEEKKLFFNKVTQILVEHLETELQLFSNEGLLKNLMEMHEALLWKRENNKTQVPAQIACFGDQEEKINEIFQLEKDLVKTSLAARCLIEFITARPSKGILKPNLDDIDRLLVIMYELTNYGFMSDSIHFGIDNPEVRKLKSGRLGIKQEFFDEKIELFAKAHTTEEVEQYIKNFDNRFELDYPISNLDDSPEDEKEFESVNKAFLIDWGISYENIYKFCICCSRICYDSGHSIITLEKDILIRKLVDEYNLPEDQMNHCIDKFALSEREKYLEAPTGYKNSDVFPWKYNREFSLARRFLVKYVSEEDTILLTWGYRNAISVQKQLHLLLMEGKLNNGGREIEKLLGKFRNSKGKRHRANVLEWLKKHPYVVVIDHEVQISIKGHLKADKDYGDVDVLAYLPKDKIVLSLECKDTNKAKNVHEIKGEIDNYLGKEGKEGMIDKHVKRDQWLKNNKEKVKALFSTDDDIMVRSYMITSEVIPTPFLKVGILPIPIISFPDIVKKGMDIFNP